MAEIVGLKELLAELRAAENASPREVTKALKPAAAQLTARAQAKLNAKGGTGKMAASARPFSTQRAAGVRFSHPGAGVEEFATQYKRRNKGGTVSVITIRKGGSPPRFLYKAIDELGPKLIDGILDLLIEIWKCHGWFVDG